jgi:hypothetical protein
MALYVPAGRRRRRVIGGLVLAVVVGLLLGFGLGRQTATSTSDDVTSVQDQARDAVGALQSAPTEYAQAAAGATAEFANGGGAGAALDRVERQVKDALDAAPWLGPASRAAALAALDDVRTVAARKGSPDEFEKAVGAAADQLEEIFGIDRASQ